MIKSVVALLTAVVSLVSGSFSNIFEAVFFPESPQTESVEFAKKYNAEYIPDMQCNIVPKGRRDLWSDSNHPNAKGNRIVADTILPALRKVLN